MTFEEQQAKLKQLFQSAEPELNEVAKKYGFTVRVVDAKCGTLYFFPEVEADHFGRSEG